MYFMYRTVFYLLPLNDEDDNSTDLEMGWINLGWIGLSRVKRQ